MLPRERFDLGLIYGRLHDFPTALALFRTVDESVPSPEAHAYAIALGQFELGDYQGAIGTLTSLSPQVGLNANSANLLAVCYSKAGRYQEAYALLVSQVRSSPNDPLGYLNLITLLTDVGQQEQAVKVATSAVEAFPDDSQMLVVRGAAYTSVSDLDKARKDFAAAVAMSPKKADPRFFLAVTDYKKGDYALAADELRSAIASGVADADLEYLLAECILKIDPDKTQDALNELDRAIHIDDRAVPAYALRGKLLLEAGDPRSAAADLEKAHSINPAMRSPTYNLARAYTALGRKAEADVLLQQIHQQATSMVNDLSDQRMQQALSDHSRSR
jgi:tetratricopeptide (TPR) repeat protein